MSLECSITAIPTALELPLRCICSGSCFADVFTYNSPPKGETAFRFVAGASYQRKIVRCERCGHMLSCHNFNDEELYRSDYVSATYGGNDGLQEAFNRVTALPPDKSDNWGRVQRLLQFSEEWFKRKREDRPREILDVGSGLCVFLAEMKRFGWKCTAIDPDRRSAEHAERVVGVHALCTDFMSVEEIGLFDVITFNKVLEHVRNPIAMLAKARLHLSETGFLYFEVPDGETAALDGPEREEFFIDHHHIFSVRSVRVLAQEAGFRIQCVERVREPSTKYTIRAFALPSPAETNPELNPEQPIGGDSERGYGA